VKVKIRYATRLKALAAAYKPIDFPYSPQRWPMAHADHVLKDGREIGYSLGTIYSYFFREVLSHGCIDIEAANIGSEVVVQWGDHGGPIKNISSCCRTLSVSHRGTEQRHRCHHPSRAMNHVPNVAIDESTGSGAKATTTG
jgi:hypothetical protein